MADNQSKGNFYLGKTSNWGKRLQHILKEKQITQREAAQVAGVQPSVIAGWTAGQSPNDFVKVKQLADHLGVSFTWLLTGTNDQKEKLSSVSELFEEQQYFDGYARIRIDRLIPRKG